MRSLTRALCLLGRPWRWHQSHTLRSWRADLRNGRYGRYFWNKRVRGITINASPIFVVGCRHSGTSLLLAVLGSHSRIYPVPFESKFALTDNVRHFRSTAKKFDRWAIAAGKRRWVEKTPAHIRCIDKILRWCPGAKILLMVRDGRDVATSIRARFGSLEYGVECWINDNLAAKPYWTHPDVCVVRYEDVVCDFEPTVKKVLRFLGEDYEFQMKDYHRTPRKWYFGKIARPSTAYGDNHEQYRNWQINQPLFDGRGRWKELSPEELSYVSGATKDMLGELGYL